MKKDNLIRSYILTLIAVILGLFISQFIVQNAIRANKDDAVLVKLAQKQGTLSEEIAKSAALLNVEKIKTNETNFNLVKRRLKEALDQFIKVRKAITKGDASLGIPRVENSEKALENLSKSDLTYQEIRDAGNELLGVAFDDPAAEKLLTLSRALTNIINQQRSMMAFLYVINII